MNKFLRFMMAGSLAWALAACGSSKAPSPFLKKDGEAAGTGMTDVKIQLAIEYMNARDYRSAVRSIDEALALSPRSDYAWLVRAEIYQYLKVPEKAEESFQRALAINPGSAEINNNYGWFVCNTRAQPGQSIAYYDRALSDPTYPTPHVAYMNKGICLGRIGRYPEAMGALERGRATAPGFAPITKEMARIKYLAGSAGDADTLFRQYQSSVTALGADDLLLGWQLAMARGDRQAAYEYEAQLRTSFPYSPEMEKITAGRAQ